MWPEQNGGTAYVGIPCTYCHDPSHPVEMCYRARNNLSYCQQCRCWNIHVSAKCPIKSKELEAHLTQFPEVTFPNLPVLM